MKPSILLIAAATLIAPLAAENEKPATDLIDLFEKSQREGATDEELRQMLEDKVELLPELRQLQPDERLQVEDFMRNELLRLRERAEVAQPDRAEGEATRPNSDRPFRNVPPRWLVGLVVKPLDPALRLHFDLPDDAGVIVESVMRGGPAAEAGFKTNDIIVAANEFKVASLDDLKAAVEKAGSDGKAVNLEVIQRGKGSVIKVTPRGPEAPTGKAEQEDPAPANRPMVEIQRRLDQQQQEIEALRRELRQLRARLQRE